jgi:hypothetical protein
VAKRILIEEIHIRIFVPAGLPPARYRAMHRTLVDKRFFRKMKQSIQAVARPFASLAQTHITLTR